MRPIVLSASLIAFSVACGYAKLLLFPYLFFVELFTVAVFLSGTLSGPAWGLWIGGVARLTFSVANPFGPPHPWVLLAQTIGGSVVGGIGGAARPWLLLAPEGSGAYRWRIPFLLACGTLATTFYDALTNAAQGIVYGSVPAALALGLLPAAQHLVSNLAIFGVIGHLAIPWLRRHPLAARHVA